MQFFSLVTNFFKGKTDLVLLLILGTILRFVGVYPGYLAHGDEIMYGEAVKMLLHGHLELELQYLGYPPLVAWLMLLGYIFIFIPLTFILITLRIIFSSGLEDYLILLENKHFFEQTILGTQWINAVYWARYLTAIFGVGVILLTYILTSKLFKNKLVSFFAAFFVTINYRLVLNSHIGFIDMYNTFFALLGLIAIINLLEKQNLKNYILAFIAVALSFIIKYQFYTLLGLFTCQLIIAFKNRYNLGLFLKSLFNRNFIISGVIATLVVVLSHIQYFQHFDRFLANTEYNNLKYGMGTNTLNLFPISYLFHIALGPILSILFMVGLVVGILKKETREKFLILFSILSIFCFLYMYYSRGGFYTRNFLASIPIILIISSFGFYNLIKIYHKLRIRILKRVALVTLFIVVFLISKDHIYNSFKVANILSQTSYKIIAEKWLEQNLPEGAVFANYSTNLKPNRKFIFKELPNPGEVLSYQELKGEGYEYSILDFFVVNHVWWMNVPPNIGIHFWKKPDDLLSQTYTALATRELLWEYAIKTFLPEWQVYGYNYAVIKEEDIRDKFYNLIEVKKIDFEDYSWDKRYFFDEYKYFLEYAKNGNTDKGSLLIRKSPSKGGLEYKSLVPGGYRFESEYFKAKPLHSMKIRGWIKSSEVVEKNSRSGFLRLDFYETNKTSSITSRPMISFVSERAYGSDWYEVIIEGVVPEKARFYKIGFQADKPSTDLYLDNVEVFESQEKVLETDMLHFTISDDDLFPPNDQGFL